MTEQNPEDRTDPRELLAAILRRRVPLLITSGCLLLIAILVAVLLPPVYRSTATILIEEQEIPQDLVRTTVTSYADQRIQVISQQVMTRSNLMKIVEKYGLYESERRFETTEEILEHMRKDIKLDLVNTDVTDRRNGGRVSATIAFTLSYDSPYADKTQKVANELTSLFLNENLQIRKQKADDTSAFLSEEAERLKQHLSENEQQLATFKMNNLKRLPELVQVNMQMRERSDLELMDIERALSTNEERRFYLESQLAQIKPNTPIISASGEKILDSDERLKSLRAQYAASSGIYGASHPDMVRTRRQIDALEQASGLSMADSSEEAKQLVKLKTDLAALSERYGAGHPDVIRLKNSINALAANMDRHGSSEDVRQVSQLKEDLRVATERHGSDDPDVLRLKGVVASLDAAVNDRSGSAAQGGKKPENPAYITLQTQIETARLESKSLQRRRDELRTRLSLLETRIEEAPGVEKDYLDISRDRESSLVRYREIKAKLMEAEIAQDLEKDRKSERFSLIDPAQYPEKPRSPNRMAILLVGLVLSLGGGMGSVAALETLDSSVRGSRDLARTLPVNILAAIPFIDTDADRLRKKLPVKRLVIGGVGALVLLLLAINFLWMPLEVFWFSLLRRLHLQ